MKTYKNKKGFTLVEIMVVVSIIGLFVAIGTPNYIEYNRRYELLNSTKELRSLLWEAQSKSLAPSGSDISSYQISLRKNQPTVKAYGYVGEDIGEEVREMAMGRGVFIEEISLDGTVLPDNARVIFATKEREAGKISLDPSGNKLRVIVASRTTDAYKYSVNIDRSLGIISFEKVNP